MKKYKYEDFVNEDISPYDIMNFLETKIEYNYVEKYNNGEPLGLTVDIKDNEKYINRIFKDVDFYIQEADKRFVPKSNNGNIEFAYLFELIEEKENNIITMHEIDNEDRWFIGGMFD